ncbi:MAG: LysR family transcriptional regulator [Propionibacteriaceae bacterium]
MTAQWPTLGVLDLLLAVSEHGSLGAAARAVGMAQPNASRALARLERDTGLVLVHREPDGSTLTEEGSVFADWSRDVLRAADRLRIGAEALRHAQEGQVTVAASMTTAEHLVPVWLAELRRIEPTSRINLSVHNSHQVFDLVRDGACDLGFVETPRVRSGLKSVTVAHDSLVVVVATTHPWARRRRPLSPGDLAETPLVVREPGSGTRLTLDAVLAPHHPVGPALELSSNAAVRTSVIAGAGPAVLSVLAVHDALRSGELRAVPMAGLDMTRRLRAVWSPPRRPTGAAGELVRIAQRIGVPDHGVAGVSRGRARGTGGGSADRR